MNLSTSSFKGDYRAILLALVMLFVVEGVVRALEPSLSIDVSHIKQIPQTLSDLANTPGEHVLFLGNSLTRRGVDMRTLRPSLASQGVNVQNLNFGFVYPDSSDIFDWLYVYRHYVSEATRPDVLILSFANLTIRDEEFPDMESIRRLAHHHTTLADTVYAFSNDLTHLSQKGDFLISKLFVSFAHRERVRIRTLNYLLPYYREAQRAISQIRDSKSSIEKVSPNYTYKRLERFLQLVNPKEVKIIIVAMPIREPYNIDPKLPRVIERAGAHFINLESVPRLTPRYYRDTQHLIPSGAAIYSKLLGRELAPLLPNTQ